MEQFATIKDAVRYLESKLTDPDAWEMTDHTFILKERPHIELWTANGVWFFGLHHGFDNEYIFGWKKFWCYYKFWWCVMRPLRKAAVIKLLKVRERKFLQLFNKTHRRKFFTSELGSGIIFSLEQETHSGARS